MDLRMVRAMTSVVEQLVEVFGEPRHELPSFPESVSEIFADSNNSPEGIRAHHALDALRKLSAVDVYQLGTGGWFALATAPVAIAVPYTMIIKVISTPGTGVMIDHAWRLYDEPDHPSAAFADVLGEFGMPVRLFGQSSIFHASARGPANEMSLQVDHEATTGSVTMAAFMNHDGTDVTVSCAYAINTTDYFHAIRLRRR
jgi:hypothetical protein